MTTNYKIEWTSAIVAVKWKCYMISAAIPRASYEVMICYPSEATTSTTLHSPSRNLSLYICIQTQGIVHNTIHMYTTRERRETTRVTHQQRNEGAVPHLQHGCAIVGWLSSALVSENYFAVSYIFSLASNLNKKNHDRSDHSPKIYNMQYKQKINQFLITTVADEGSCCNVLLPQRFLGSAFLVSARLFLTRARMLRVWNSPCKGTVFHTHFHAVLNLSDQ